MARRQDPGFWSQPPVDGDLEPFDLGSGELGVMLVHGFCGTPPEMRDLGEHLAAAGFRVRGVLLPGHGSSPEELEATSWTDWVAGAQAELDSLKQECRLVFCAGQSMGGAISLLMAARNPDVAAVATCAALVSLGRMTEAQIHLGRRLIRWHRTDPTRVDLWNREAVNRLRSYNRRSMKSHVDLLRLYQQARRELPAVSQPALVLHGRRDATVPPANAEIIRAAIGPHAVVRYFERSGHAMSVDVDAPEIQALVTEHFLAAAALKGVPVPGPGPRVVAAV